MHDTRFRLENCLFSGIHSAQALEITNLHKLRSLDYIMHKPLCLSLCIHLEFWNSLGLLLRQNPWQFWVQNNTLLLLRGLSKKELCTLYCAYAYGTCVTKSLTNKINHSWILLLLNLFLPCTCNAPDWYIQRSNTKLHWSRCDSSYTCSSFNMIIISYRTTNNSMY